MARRNKNGQFTKKTTRRRRASPSSAPRRSRGKQATSVLKVAETALVANAVTQGMFNADLRTFITGRINGAYRPSLADNVITLPEMLGFDRAATKGMGGKPTGGVSIPAGLQMETIKRNVQANALTMGLQIVGLPLAFKYGKKILSKPVINPTNKLLRSVGIKELKV